MSALSNWREEFNLSEVVTGKMTDKEALKKVSEKSGINNKVTINPKLDEAVKEIGGEVVSMVEADTTAQKQRLDMKQMILDRQKLKLRRKDMSAAKQEKNQGVDGDPTGSSKQSNVIAQEETEVKEGVMKMVKRVIRGKKVERKPQKATDAGAVARRKLQQKDHETVNFLPMNESDKPEKDIAKVNEKKRKNALQIQKVIGEDKGFDYVLAKLKAKHGDGVLTKGDKIKSPSAAQKKKNAEIMAKRAKQDGRDATEKASDGRYNDRSRSD